MHVAQHTALVGRDATFKSVVVTFGGDVVRLHPRVGYAGPGGEAELFGLYFTDDGQHQEHRLFVDHDAPHCRSPTSPTRARCRARTRTRCGSATC